MIKAFTTLAALIVATICIGIGCETNPKAPKVSSKLPKERKTTTSLDIQQPQNSKKSIALTKKGKIELKQVPEPARKALTSSINSLAVDLYKAVEKKGNFIISPYGAAIALSQIQNGAEGPTADKLKRILHPSYSLRELNASLTDFLVRLSGQYEVFGDRDGNYGGTPHELTVASSLWLKKGHVFNSDYINSMKDLRGVRVGNADFKKQPQIAAKQINDWIADITKQRIKNVATVDDFSEITRIYLSSVVYFKAEWVEGFPEKNTAREEFHVDKKSQIGVSMMKSTINYHYKEDKNVQVVKVDYLSTPGSAFCLAVILPRKIDGLESLERKLSPAHIKDWTAVTKERKWVDLWLPKFETASAVDLKKPLELLGLGSIFAAGTDLSKISSTEPLWLDKLKQNSWIKIDEKGTEAASATHGGVMGQRGDRDDPFVFHADHPFMYLVYDKKSGAIVFMGRVVNPVPKKTAE